MFLRMNLIKIFMLFLKFFQINLHLIQIIDSFTRLF